MSCKGTSNTNKHLINILFKLAEKVEYLDNGHKINNSIDSQLGLLQDFKDVILATNYDANLLPSFFMQLKISPRKG